MHADKEFFCRILFCLLGVMGCYNIHVSFCINIFKDRGSIHKKPFVIRPSLILSTPLSLSEDPIWIS